MRNCANRDKWKFIASDPRTLIFKALSCEHRIHIIEILKYGEHSVSEVAEFMSIHPSVVSRHLAMLQSAGLITSRRAGTEVFYRLSSDEVLKLTEDAAAIVEDIRKSRGY